MRYAKPRKWLASTDRDARFVSFTPVGCMHTKSHERLPRDHHTKPHESVGSCLTLAEDLTIIAGVLYVRRAEKKIVIIP